MILESWKRWSFVVMEDLEEGKDFPNLVVVDGGIGQVMSASKAFCMLESDFIPLIGLAKREEPLFFLIKETTLNSANDPVLRLLQRVRTKFIALQIVLMPI